MRRYIPAGNQTNGADSVETPTSDNAAPGTTGQDAGNPDPIDSSSTENATVQSSIAEPSAPVAPAKAPAKRATAPAKAPAKPPGKAAAPAKAPSKPPAKAPSKPAGRPKGNAAAEVSSVGAYRSPAELVKLIADPTRMAVVSLLASGPLNVTQLCEKLGHQTQPAVSHHLALLRHGRIIAPERSGKNNVYSLTDEYGVPMSAIITDMMSIS